VKISLIIIIILKKYVQYYFYYLLTIFASYGKIQTEVLPLLVILDTYRYILNGGNKIKYVFNSAISDIAHLRYLLLISVSAYRSILDNGKYRK